MTFSIRNKIAFLFAVGLFQISLIFLLVFSSEVNEHYRQLIIQRGSSVADQLAFKTEKLLALGLYPQEFFGYSSLLQQTIDGYEGVKFAALSDQLGETIFTAGEHTPDLGAVHSIVRWVTSPSGTEYKVSVEVDTDLIQQKTLSFVLSVLFYSVVMIIISILVVIHFLKVNIGKPIGSFIHYLEGLDLNNISEIKLNLSERGDEIGIVAKSFDRALSRLDLSQKSLQKSNRELVALTEELEERVKERTKELEEANKMLNSIAYIDSLTGLLNRVSFNDLVEQRFRHAIENKNSFAIAMVDLDGFKQVNDRFGHAAGDRVLKVIGERITASAKYGETVFRIGGDEFVFLFEQYHRASHSVINPSLEHLANKIQAAMSQPIYYNNQLLPFGVSIGIVSREQCETCTVFDLLAIADRVMYQAKSQGVDYLIYQSEAQDSPLK